MLQLAQAAKIPEEYSEVRTFKEYLCQNAKKTHTQGGAYRAVFIFKKKIRKSLHSNETA